MTMKNYKNIQTYLNSVISNPKCELNYFNDWSLLISIVLSAQTTDKRVNQVSSVLFSKYPTLSSLAKTPISSLKEILKPLGSYNKKAIYVHDIANVLHNDYKDIVPTNEDDLIKLNGVGRKTINVFLAEFYDLPKIAVDTHVLRVSKRLGLTKSDNPLVVEKDLMRIFKKDDWSKIHLQLVLFGRYYCKAMKPECVSCGLKKECLFYQEKEIKRKES